MIDVESLTRFYGSVPAVQDVSFAIEERQIVGLLGHNGAGKTTVMKMLSMKLKENRIEDSARMAKHHPDLDLLTEYASRCKSVS